ncbi:MAG TPA: hypothetical protein VMJ10_01620 [Kofleriaceae bacterium]|nr:hypothetical protein [Kofleriaceae bacterium]
MRDEDRYRLAPVREVRELAERAQRGELAGAVDSVRHAEARLAAARERVARARTAVQAALAARDAQPTAATRALADRFAARRRHELVAARHDELRAELARDDRAGEVDLARRSLARARADREVIERHFARWRDDRRKLAERRED